MADSVQETGLGTPERVALDLTRLIIYESPADTYKGKDAILDLYAECRRAARGSRS